MMIHGLNNLPTLEPTTPAKDLCKDCIGLDYCKQELTGMIPHDEEYMGTIRTRLTPCNYKRTKMERARLDRLFKDAHIPERYADCYFDSFHISKHNQDAVNAAYDVIEKDKGVIFYGERGTGKTMLASIIANEMNKQGKNALFTSMPELFDSIRARFKEGNAKDIVDGVKDAAYLILDDVGTEKMTRWVSEQLFIIINHRYNKQLPLIITTNYEPKEFARRLCVVDSNGPDRISAERIISRLNEMCKFVRVGGTDWRMKGAG